MAVGSGGGGEMTTTGPASIPTPSCSQVQATFLHNVCLHRAAVIPGAVVAPNEIVTPPSSSWAPEERDAWTSRLSALLSAASLSKGSHSTARLDAGVLDLTDHDVAEALVERSRCMLCLQAAAASIAALRARRADVMVRCRLFKTNSLPRATA